MARAMSAAHWAHPLPLAQSPASRYRLQPGFGERARTGVLSPHHRPPTGDIAHATDSTTSGRISKNEHLIPASVSADATRPRWVRSIPPRARPASRLYRAQAASEQPTEFPAQASHAEPVATRPQNRILSGPSLVPEDIHASVEWIVSQALAHQCRQSVERLAQAHPAVARRSRRGQQAHHGLIPRTSRSRRSWSE
jgi:hypothetical protein